MFNIGISHKNIGLEAQKDISGIKVSLSEKIITQSYDYGEYDTGYFAPSALPGDVDEYISDKNNPMSLSLKKYKEVIKTLSE